MAVIVQVVCKVTRAWTPPDAFWLFPARAQEFRSGGWYVEWTGHDQHDRIGWLHPGIICLWLGFRALDLEAGVHRPWWLAALQQRFKELKAT